MELLGRYSNQTDVLTRLTRLAALPVDRPPEQDLRPARQAQHRLRADEVFELTEAYRAGDGVYLLAKAFTIDRRTVSAILERHGIRRRYNLLDAHAVAEAARLYETRWSLARLADHSVSPLARSRTVGSRLTVPGDHWEPSSGRGRRDQTESCTERHIGDGRDGARMLAF